MITATAEFPGLIATGGMNFVGAAPRRLVSIQCASSALSSFLDDPEVIHACPVSSTILGEISCRSGEASRKTGMITGHRCE